MTYLPNNYLREKAAGIITKKLEREGYVYPDDLIQDRPVFRLEGKTVCGECNKNNMWTPVFEERNPYTPAGDPEGRTPLKSRKYNVTHFICLGPGHDRECAKGVGRVMTQPAREGMAMTLVGGPAVLDDLPNNIHFGSRFAIHHQRLQLLPEYSNYDEIK